MSKLFVFFDVPDMSAAQYDQVMRDLDAAGAAHPAGRTMHVCSSKGAGSVVLDLWDSEATLNAFAGTLMPILIKNGVNPPQPQVSPVHNIVTPG